MGVRLIREVLDHAPADLSPAELVVLFVLAEAANDATREAWPGADVLGRRTRLADRSVRAALGRLAARGIELRVPLGKDKRGRPVYSAPGRRVTYALPALTDGGTMPPNGGTSVPPSTEEWRHVEVRMAASRGRNGGTSVPPIPSANRQEPSAAAKIITERINATDAEATAAVEFLRRDRPDIRNPAAALTRFDDGELTALVANARADARRHQVETWAAWADQQPDCEHGKPGGDQPHPSSGEPRCVSCRARARRNP